jgi:hypothetical protein
LGISGGWISSAGSVRGSRSARARAHSQSGRPTGIASSFAAGYMLDTIYEKASSGAGEEKELLRKLGEIKVPSSWSRDGRFSPYFNMSRPNTAQIFWVLPLEGDRKPVLLLGTEFNERDGSFSPDMCWIHTPPMSRAGMRSTSGHSRLRDLRDHLSAEANGRFRKTAEQCSNGAPTARGSFSAVPMDRRWRWT